MYQVKVNDKLNFEVKRDKGTLTVNGENTEADVSQLGALQYHVIHNMASYNVELISLDKATKTAELKVNGNVYTVTAKDQFDLLLDKLGLSSLNSTRVSEIKAPMPGMVLKVFVAEGDSVPKGGNLFILEAMKMENIIKSPIDGVISHIEVKKGESVEKNQVLLHFQ